MGVFSEEENPRNGGQFESDIQAWEYIIVGNGLPGQIVYIYIQFHWININFIGLLNA